MMEIVIDGKWYLEILCFIVVKRKEIEREEEESSPLNEETGGYGSTIPLLMQLKQRTICF